MCAPLEVSFKKLDLGRSSFSLNGNLIFHLFLNVLHLFLNDSVQWLSQSGIVTSRMIFDFQGI